MSATLAEAIRVVLADDVEARYGIYVLREGEPHRVAECERDAIGTCLVSLADDNVQAGETQAQTFGVLDQVERRWISGLWPGRSS
jgi:hypothetical protein